MTFIHLLTFHYFQLNNSCFFLAQTEEKETNTEGKFNEFQASHCIQYIYDVTNDSDITKNTKIKFIFTQLWKRSQLCQVRRYSQHQVSLQPKFGFLKKKKKLKSPHKSVSLF